MTEQPQPLRRLANSVDEWAELRGVSDDPYLQSLILALEEERDLDVLERVDPLDYMPKPSTPQGDRRLVFSNFLTVIRNVLVFVPVAITWKAVAEATDAFGRFTEDNSATTVNFLQFWQNGYGYLDPFWGIANIAQIDFIIILGIIGLTLIIGYLINSAQQVKFLSAREIDQERAVLSLEILRTLHPYRSIEPNQIASETGRAIHDLSQVTREISSIATILQSTTAALANDRSALESLATDIEVSRDAWSNEVAEQLRGLSGGVREAGDHLESSMRDLAQTATDLSSGLHGKVTGEISEIAEILRAASLELAQNRRSLESLAANVEASREVWSNEVAEQLRMLSGGVREAGDHLEGSMRDLAQTAAELRSSLNGSLRASLEESTEAFQEVATQVASTGRAVNANSKMLQDDLIDLHRRLQRMLTEETQ